MYKKATISFRLPHTGELTSLLVSYNVNNINGNPNHYLIQCHTFTSPSNKPIWLIKEDFKITIYNADTANGKATYTIEYPTDTNEEMFAFAQECLFSIMLLEGLVCKGIL